MTLPQTDTLDPYAILDTLGVSDVSVVEKAHGGTDTVIWRVTQTNGAVYALRVFRAGEQADCERERQVMQAASDAGLPVPAVHAAGDWRGRPALLLTWLPGWPVVEELRRRPWRAWRMGVRFGETQAAIHAIAAPETLGARPHAWIEWLGSGEPALAERLRAQKLRGDALLHLDYHPLNVITDGERMTGVLDWRNAAAGDPRADTARTFAILRVDAPRQIGLPARAVLWMFERGWRAGYRRQAGPRRDMPLFYAWAGAGMLRDLAAKRTPADLAHIRRWTERWLTHALQG